MAKLYISPTASYNSSFRQDVFSRRNYLAVLAREKAKYFLLMFFVFKVSGYLMAQNAIVGSGFSTGWGGACGSNTNFSYFSSNAGSSFSSGTLTPNGVGNQYWRIGVDWSGTIKQLHLNTTGTDVAVTPNVAYTLNSSCVTAGAMYYNVATNNNRYIFKTRDAGTNPSNTFVFFELTGTPVTITEISQAPVASNVQPGQAVSISATMNGTLPDGQGVWLRYSTDNFTTSTCVRMTGSGTSYSGTIPGAVNTSAAAVRYYVFTSGTPAAIAHGDADLYTINFINNGGANYSYNVAAATTIYLHNFNDGPTVSPYNTQPTATTGTPVGVFNSNLTASSWVSSTGDFTNFLGSSGQSIVIQPSNASTSSITLTFNITPGYELSVSSFNFWRQRSSTNGPNISSITINNVLIFGNNVSPTTGAFIGTTNVSNPVSGLTGTVSLVINLTAPSSASTNFRLDDFTINGTVTLVSTPVNVFSVGLTNNCAPTAALSWALPLNFDPSQHTVLIFAKPTSAVTIGTSTNSLSTYTANTNFGSGTAYQNDPAAFCVYKGTGTSVSLSNLQNNTPYHFLFLTVRSPNTYSSGTGFSFTTGPSNVSGHSVISGNGQISLNWANPTDCYDEIMVVATDNAGGVASVPSGDGTAYVANTLYNDGANHAGLNANEFTVYKGTGTNVDITGLVNGTTYYIKIFTRKNSVWSLGVTTSGSPAASVVGAFRTKSSGSGDWTAHTTWDVNTGSGWVAAASGQYPNSTTSDVTILTGYTVRLDLSSRVVRNLTIDVGGRLYTNTTSSGNKYLTVYGNITDNGTIGTVGGNDEISFNIEGNASIISGSGSFYCSRLRKSVTATTTNLIVDMNIFTTFSGVQIYNNYSGTSAFNLTLNAGKTITCLNNGSVAIDGANPLSTPPAGTQLAYGKYTINGTLVVNGTFFLVTNNTNVATKCEVEIGATGTVNAASVNATSSNSATHTFTIQNGGKLNLTGTGGFLSFSATNNTYVLNAGSTVEYSAASNQTVEANLAYSNLTLSGSGIKTANGSFSIGRNLTLSGGTLSLPNLQANIAASGTVTGNGGNLDAGTNAGTFNFVGAGAINGTSPLSFYNVWINAGTVIQSVNNTTIANLRLIGGFYSVGTNQTLNISSGGSIISSGGDLAAGTAAGLVFFSGSGTVTGAVNFYQCTIAGGVTFGTAAAINQTLQINTNGFVAANPPTYASGSTLIYNSNGNYQRNAEWSTGAGGVGVPFHVTVQNSTNLLFDFNNANQADRHVRGNLTLGNSTGTGSLDMGAMNKKIVVNGDIFIGGTSGLSTLKLSSVFAGDLQVNGNWFRNSFGAFDANTRAVFLDGSIASTITAPSLETFHYLYINKTGSASVSLSSDIQVNNILGFTSGNISTGSGKVIIPQGGVINNAGTGTGWVAGNLQKYIAAVTTDVGYEIGGPSTYRPIIVRFSTVGTPGSLTASTVDTEHPNIGNSGIDPNKDVNAYVSLTPGTLSSSGIFTVTFNYTDADVDPEANRLNFHVSRYNGTAWVKPAVSDITTNSIRTTTSDLVGAIDFVIGECFRPNTSNLAISAFTACYSHSTKITLTSNTLSPGTYDITYTLTDANNNTTSNVIASDVIFTGTTQVTGSFQTPVLTISGNTTITIGKIELKNALTCERILSSGNAHSFAVGTTNTWTGTNSTDWQIDANWGCGFRPPDGYDVTIPASLPLGSKGYPELSSDVIVGSLELYGSSTVALNDKSFTLNKSLTGTGSLIGSALSTLVFNGSGASTVNFKQTPNGESNALGSLAVNSGSVTLATPLHIFDVLTIAGGTLDLDHKNLVLKSTATKTARVAERLGTLSNATDVLVERYIPDLSSRRYRLLTAPLIGISINQAWQEGMVTPDGAVTHKLTNTATPATPQSGHGTLITGSVSMDATTANNNGFDWWSRPALIAPAGASVRYYQGATSNLDARWMGLGSTKSTAFDGNQAYLLFVRGDRFVSTGTATKATLLRPRGVLKEADSYSLDVLNFSHTLLGNPYASPIDFSKVFAELANENIIQPYYWTWQASLGTGTGGYVLIRPKSSGGYEALPNGISPGETVSPIIGSGEGFFVVPKSLPVPSPGKITIQQKHKAAGNPAISVFRQQDREPSRLYINLHTNVSGTNTLLDGVLSSYSAERRDEPGIPKALNTGENLSVYSEGKDLIVFAGSSPQPGDVLQLRLWNTTEKEYTLAIHALTFTTSGLSAYLLDKYLQQEKPLNLSSTPTFYKFTVNPDAASKDPLRFAVLFKTVAVPLPLVITHFSGRPQNGINLLEWKVPDETGITRYKLEKSPDGQVFNKLLELVAAAGGGSQTYTAIDGNPFASTYYRVQMVGKNNDVRFSPIVKVVSQKSESISAYPTIVIGGSLHLQMTNQQKGTYTVVLRNIAGQQVWQQRLKHEGGSTTKTLYVGRDVAAGGYLLEVKNGNRRKETIKIQIAH